MKVTDIKPEVFAMAQRVQAKLGERFAEIDAVAEENTRRVMTAFQDNLYHLYHPKDPHLLL